MMNRLNKAKLAKEPYVADCPFSKERVECGLLTCDGCPIRGEYNTRENERIADNMRGFWKEQANLSTDWRG